MIRPLFTEIALFLIPFVLYAAFLIATRAGNGALEELARQGLSNPQIAKRLVLSVRTVESHIYRAMQKLGVSDRRDL